MGKLKAPAVRAIKLAGRYGDGAVGDIARSCFYIGSTATSFADILSLGDAALTIISIF